MNLGFWHGTSVSDPHGMLEGTGKVLRHVKVTSEAMARSADLRALIASAQRERAGAG